MFRLVFLLVPALPNTLVPPQCVGESHAAQVIKANIIFEHHASLPVAFICWFILVLAFVCVTNTIVYFINYHIGWTLMCLLLTV